MNAVTNHSSRTRAQTGIPNGHETHIPPANSVAYFTSHPRVSSIPPGAGRLTAIPVSPANQFKPPYALPANSVTQSDIFTPHLRVSHPQSRKAHHHTHPYSRPTAPSDHIFSQPIQQLSLIFSARTRGSAPPPELEKLTTTPIFSANDFKPP